MSHDRRLPDTSRISKILKWPIPRNKTEVRGFLGLCGTIQIWIKDYSLIARPLTELTRNEVSFEWDTRRQESFDILKKLITNPPVLHPIDYAKTGQLYFQLIHAPSLLASYSHNMMKKDENDLHDTDPVQ